MKQEAKIKLLISKGKNYPLSYWKTILFHETESFWEAFEKELRIERKNNKFSEFKLTLKLFDEWKREYIFEKHSEKSKQLEARLSKKEEVSAPKNNNEGDKNLPTTKKPEENEEGEIREIEYKGELDLAGFKSDCGVLKDGTRILSGRGMAIALRITEKDDKKASGNMLRRILTQKSLQPFLNAEKRGGDFLPIIYYDKKANNKINGYKATLLPDICDAYLKFRRETEKQGKKLSVRQKIIANQCEIILSSFAKLGIIAFVDMVSGYKQPPNNLLSNSYGPFTYSLKENTVTYQNQLLWKKPNDNFDAGGYWFFLKTQTSEKTEKINLWVKLGDNYQITTHLKIYEKENDKETEKNYQAFFHG